jgi:hypothetical protein
MSAHRYKLIVVAALALALLAAGGVTAGQGENQSIPRTADGKPDFSGFWSNPRGQSSTGAATVFSKDKMAAFRPGGQALFYEPRTGDPFHDEPRAFCLPSGFPSGFFGPFPIQIVQSKDWLVMVTEFQRITRLIPLDGRPHRKGIEPTYYGDSVGHWEGDTLVIDSRNFKRWSLDDYYYTNPKEYRMHSEEFHVIERLRRVEKDRISYQFTVDDPQIFTAPWTEDFEMKLNPQWEKDGLYEFVCEENNRCPGGQCRK